MEVSADFRGKISQNFVETVQTPGSEAEYAKKKKKKKKKSHMATPHFHISIQKEKKWYLTVGCWYLIEMLLL